MHGLKANSKVVNRFTINHFRAGSTYPFRVWVSEVLEYYYE